MRKFGIEIRTVKSAKEEAIADAKSAVEAMRELKLTCKGLTADRDGANRTIARLVHNAAELTLLKAAIREAGPGIAKKVNLIFERISGKMSTVAPDIKINPEKEVRDTCDRINDGGAFGKR